MIRLKDRELDELFNKRNVGVGARFLPESHLQFLPELCLARLCFGPGKVGDGLQQVGELLAHLALIKISQLDHNHGLSVLLCREKLIYYSYNDDNSHNIV